MTTIAERIEYSAARRAMIDSQLRVSGVNDEWVLGAMGDVPREAFVPAAARGYAYIDRAIPLGDGRALPAPLVQGSLLEEAGPRVDDRVLIVSCGSDYLAELVRTRCADVTVIDAASASGSALSGTYSLIVIDGAVEYLPAGLTAALAEGGRIVTGLAERGVTRLAAGRKLGEQVALVTLADLGMPVMADFAKPKAWSF